MYDYFIIGGGIAGSTLAYKMYCKGFKVKVFDDKNSNISSRIAGGIVNPLTGKRTALTWKANEIFDALHYYYPYVENKLNESFFKLMPTYKLFESAFEQNEWLNKSAEREYNRFFDNKPVKLDEKKIENPYGALLIKETAKLDVLKYLDSIHKFFIERNVLEYCKIEEIYQTETVIKIKENEAKAIIYCDGTFVAENYYFKNLPHKPVHGEVLEVEIDNFYDDRMINKGIFIIPKSDNKYIVGSTYNWSIKEAIITEKGRSELEKKLNNLLKLPYKTISHYAGIRPSTNDRRPYLGKHPDYANVYIFGGMGSKGVSLVPYLSDIFILYISENVKIPTECDIKRVK
ncbi:MAG: FAD-dependent oxidoreductase [Bacteroidia bacterium]|nr:FAD-dependent oxidoreductase [Bacteroidia bacterium]